MGNVKKLINLIQKQNKEESTLLAIKMLDNKEVSIVELYEDILRKALNEFNCEGNERECIWKEHTQTAIVRTIIEITYPYILDLIKNVEKNGKKVLVVCPPEEYHEIGAKMAHDYFVLNGFESTFIGANTPVNVIIDAAIYNKPDFVALSVTNPYNLVNAKKIIEEIKNTNKDIKILAGGQAFSKKGSLEAVDADIYISDYKSIEDLA